MSDNIIDTSCKVFLEKAVKEATAVGQLKKSDIEMFNPLVLAYVGDAIYAAFVRTLLVSKGSMPVSKLHKNSILYVKAKAQAEILESIHPMLTEEEQTIVRRGRNTKSATVPKNADMSDYRYATGFEALVGYLYLVGNIDRLMELFNKIISIKEGF